MAYGEELTMTMSVLPGAMTGISTLMGGLVSINNVFMDLTRQIDATFGLVDTTIVTASTVVAQFGFQAAQAFGEFEQGLKVAQMVSNQTAQDMDYLKNKANEFAVSYRMDIDQLTEGLQTLGRAGLNSASEQTEVLREGLSTAKLESRDLNGVLEELIQNTALLGGNLKDSSFGESSKYVNDLLVATSMTAPITTHDVSETLKYSGGIAAAAGANINSEEGKKILEDYMGAIAAFAQKGVTGSIAGTALRAFFNKPATQDESVKDALASIKLKPEYLWEEGEDTMKPVSEQIAIIKNQMDELNISTMDQLQIWSKIVGGKMGQQMMKLDSNDIKTLTRDIQSADDAGSLAAGTFQTFQSNMKEMTEQGQVAFRSFGENVARFLNPVLYIITKILEMLSNPAASMALFAGFAAFLTLAASKIKNVFGNLKSEFRTFMEYFQKDEELYSIRPSSIRKANRLKTGGDLRDYKKLYQTDDPVKAFLREQKDVEQEHIMKKNGRSLSVAALYELSQSKYKLGGESDLKNMVKILFGENSYSYKKLRQGNILLQGEKELLGIDKITPSTMIQTLIKEGKFKSQWADYFFDNGQDFEKLMYKFGPEIINSYSGVIDKRLGRSKAEETEMTRAFRELNQKRLDQAKGALQEHYGYSMSDVDHYDPNELEEEWAALQKKYEKKYEDDPVKLKKFHETLNTIDKEFRARLQTFTTSYYNKLQEFDKLMEKGEMEEGLQQISKEELLRKGEVPRQSFDVPSQINDIDSFLAHDISYAEFYAVLHDWQYSDGSGRAIKNVALREKMRQEKEMEGLSLKEQAMKRMGIPLDDDIETALLVEDRYQNLSEDDLAELRLNDKNGIIIPEGQAPQPIDKRLSPTIQDYRIGHLHAEFMSLRREADDYVKKNYDKLFDETKEKKIDTFENINPYAGMSVEEMLHFGASQFVKENPLKISSYSGAASGLTVKNLPVDKIVNHFFETGEMYYISKKEFEQFTLGDSSKTIGDRLDKKKINKLYETFLENYYEFFNNLTTVLEPIYKPESKPTETNLSKYFEETVDWNDRGIVTAVGGKIGNKGGAQKIIEVMNDLVSTGNINLNEEFAQKLPEERLKLLSSALGINYKDYLNKKGLIDRNALFKDINKKFSKTSDESNESDYEDKIVEEKKKEHENLEKKNDEIKKENKKTEEKQSLEEKIVEEKKNELEDNRKSSQKPVEESKRIMAQQRKHRQIKKDHDRVFDDERLNAPLKEVQEEFEKKVDKTYGEAVFQLKVNTARTKRKLNELKKELQSIPDEKEVISFPKKSKRGIQRILNFVNSQEVGVGMGGITSPDLLKYLLEISDDKEPTQYRRKDVLERYRALRGIDQNGNPLALPGAGKYDFYRLSVEQQQELLNRPIPYSTRLGNFFTKDRGIMDGIRGTYWNWGAMKNLPENATGWQQLKGVGSNLVSLAGGPLMMAIEAVTVAINMVQQAYQNYHNELKEISDELKNAYSERDSAENGLKQAYRNQNEDATDEDIEAFVLDIYAQQYDEFGTSEWIKKASKGIDSQKEYEYDKEKDDGSYKEKEEETDEEKEYADAIKKNTGALYKATGEIQLAMSKLTNKMNDWMWGTDGLSTVISDFVGSLSTAIFDRDGERFSDSGDFLLTASQKDENYPGNKEMSGLFLEDMKDANGDLLVGLTTMLGEDARDVISTLPSTTKTALTDMAKFSAGQGLGGLTSSGNRRLQASMMNNKKDWQALAKEVAKYESKTGKKVGKKDTGVKRLENLVKKLATETSLGRMQILQAQSLQQMQDMYSIAQQIFVPLATQQADAAAAHYQLATTGIDPSSKQAAQGALSTSEITSTIASMVAVIAQTKAVEAAYNNAILAGDKDALDAKDATDYLKKGIGKSRIEHLDFGALASGNIGGFYSKEGKRVYDGGNSEILKNVYTTFETMGEMARNPNWTEDEALKYAQEKLKPFQNDDGTWKYNPEVMFKTIRENYSGAIAPSLLATYLGSDIGENDSGGSGSGSGSGDKDNDNGTRKERVDLVLCNRKTIPKLNVNLFKKPPSFTILNKNFKLRDVKINSEDKPKAIMAAIKNSFIDIQKRTDPKIIQDEDAVYDPAAATDGTNVPSGSAKTNTS